MLNHLNRHRFLPDKNGDPLTDKLNRSFPLDAAETQALHALVRNCKRLKSREVIIHEGSKPCFAFALISGIAFRFKHLANGRRQIFGYLLPGDLCDLQFILANRCDHSIGFLTDAEIAIIPAAELTRAMSSHPRIEGAIRRSSMIEEAILREWLLNIGQRGAVQKLAHFLCEISARLAAVEMVASNGSFAISLTQSELADTMGLTAVHVNRCLQRLREAGLVNWNRGCLMIIDRKRLIEFAEFDGSYLQIAPAGSDMPRQSSRDDFVWAIPAIPARLSTYA